MLNPLNRQTAELPITYPTKIIQFGGGNFLRGFMDWMVDILNETTDFEAGVIIVKPTPSGRYDDLREQDGLFHVSLTGLEGSPIRLVRCVNGVVNPYTDFDAYLDLARGSAVRFIISNTTESGITYDEGDQFQDKPANTFPAKLTQLLYARYQHFEGDPAAGLIILPTELVEDNGRKLALIVLKYADLWGLEPGFSRWLETACTFCNTLVDRIVPGFPTQKAADIFETIGYEDNLLIEAESYLQFVIEAPNRVAAELPFHQTDLNVHFVKDLTPYRLLKVRILNGAHTAMTLVGLLYGLESVQQAVTDELLGRFIHNLLAEEILPTLDFPAAKRLAYMEDTIQRFHNPDLHHRLYDISLNSLSKFRVRLLPSLFGSLAVTGRLPERIILSLAALIIYYKGRQNGETYRVREDAEVVAWFKNLWETPPSWPEMARRVLQETDFWGQDLTAVSGLTDRLAYYLQSIAENGIKSTLTNLVTP